MSDVVGSVLRRLGLAGAVLIAAVFVFGVLAGAVVVNRLSATPTADVQEQGDQADRTDKAEQGDKAEQEAEDQGESKSKHPNNGHGQKAKSPEKSPDTN
jgi:hypothetical protein